MLDIDFGSAGDDRLEPLCLRGCIHRARQNTRATASVATVVKCVDDRDESVLQVGRKGADEFKKESAFHRLRSQIWVVAKAFCYNCSKRGEDYGQFVDESWKDIHGLAQIRVVPPAEKRSSKMVSLVKACTDRMGYRRFSDSG